MPSNPTAGTVSVSVELPAELRDELQALSRAQRRSFKSELVVAIERHLETPPPPLPPLPPLPPVVKRGRGRPRKDRECSP